MKVISSIATDPRLEVLKQRVRSLKGAVHVSGLWGSSAPMIAAHLAAGVPRTILYITAHLEEADHARDDIELFLGRACEIFPAWESVPGEGAGSAEIEAERLRLCTALLRGNRERLGSIPSSQEGTEGGSPVIVAPIQGLMQPVPAPEALIANTLHLSPGKTASAGKAKGPDAVVRWAVERGYERLELVESPGDVARRGDIVDLFVPGEPSPYRIQFDGDELESIPSCR